MENLKQEAAIKAAEFVKDGMIVGLGTGSTTAFFVQELGRRMKEESLQITGVTTSSQTSQLAQSLNIPLKDIDQVGKIDLTIDGADEVDSQLNGIKGGGAALLMEKIVATYSTDYMWIIDESKLSECLGAFKLPVEVIPYGSDQLFKQFEKQGYTPSYRTDEKGQKLVTDMQHYIIDLDLKSIENPEKLAQKLDQTVGVVEHGLFNNMVKKVIVAGQSGIQILEK